MDCLLCCILGALTNLIILRFPLYQFPLVNINETWAEEYPKGQYLTLQYRYDAHVIYWIGRNPMVPSASYVHIRYPFLWYKLFTTSYPVPCMRHSTTHRSAGHQDHPPALGYPSAGARLCNNTPEDRSNGFDAIGFCYITGASR